MDALFPWELGLVLRLRSLRSPSLLRFSETVVSCAETKNPRAERTVELAKYLAEEYLADRDRAKRR
jgi:hypothetical protein